nr:GGDEF domain-containing protein [Micromonospora sp. DSM 115978]
RGHEAGADMLRAAADRLGASGRRSDTVARLGGDEFAVILDGYDDPVALAKRLMTELERPYRVAGTELPVLASIGVAVAGPDTDVRAATLLRTADVAMYEAKQGGKGRVAVRRLG